MHHQFNNFSAILNRMGVNEENGGRMTMRLGDSRLELELDLDSALDIGAARVNGVDVSPGEAVPDDGDARILHAVQGFMFTCGPDHIRHPEPIGDDAARRYPLHGSMAGHKAEIISETRDDDGQSIEARIRVALADGGKAEILRLWRFDATDCSFRLEDRLINAGGRPFAPMMMYHMNVGARLFDDRAGFESASFEGGRMGWRFGPGEGHVLCTPAVAEDDEKARIALGPIAGANDARLHVWFDADAIPHLQMWRNEAGHCNVIGIEPATHPLMKRTALAEAGLMSLLNPGDEKVYRLGFRFA